MLFGKLARGGTVRVDLKTTKKDGEKLTFSYLSREQEKAKPKRRKKPKPHDA